MTWHELQPVAVFLVTFVASAFSGMAGGGGGFIVNPFLIALGLTPQQTVATAKFVSFGLTGGSILAFRERMLQNKRFSLFIIVLSAVIGIIASLLLRKVDNKSLQLLMGIITLAMVPFMLKKARGLKSTKVNQISKVLGAISLAFILFLQGILSGGIGSLVSAIFIVFFGTTALEANILKRKASLVLNVVIVVSLLGSGLINYKFGFFGMAGGLLGGYVGSRIAIKNGDEFAKYALLVFMVVSGVWLVVTA